MEFDPGPVPADEFHPAARDWRLAHIVQSGSLAFQQTQMKSNGLLYSRYTLYVKDSAVNRMVPHTLGWTERTCTHVACELVLANAFAAGYAVQSGWANDHSNQLATDMLRGGGVHQP